MDIHTHIEKAVKRSDLAITDAAMALIARIQLDIDATTCALLSNRIRSDTYDWIDTEPLFDICLRFLSLFLYDSSLINGEMNAKLATRLLNAEHAVGGPYATDDSHTMIATNAMIAQLFEAFGAPLPNVISYLEEAITKNPQVRTVDTTAWALGWPHRIVPTHSIDLDVISHSSQLSFITREAIRSYTVAPEHHAQQVKSIVPSFVAQEVNHDIRKLPPEIRRGALKVWQQVVKADKNNEVSLLALSFIHSLPNSDSLPADLAKQLGVANFYAWMAYTTYDDFIDGEGERELLPVANLTHRLAVTHFTGAAPSNKQRKSDINSYFDDMDTANSWELRHCRYDIVGNDIIVGKIPLYRTGMVLARRARVHVLGPKIILEYIKNISDQQRRAVATGLDQYIIARQINDDLHDWREDLSKGHISYVVAFLLRETSTRPGTYSIDELTKQLQSYFWQEGLEKLCTMIQHFSAQANECFNKSELLIDDNEFVRLTLAPITDSAQQSKLIIADQKRFVTTLSKMHK